jgi:hypothetical protein
MGHAQRSDLAFYALTLVVTVCGAGLFLAGFFPDAELSTHRGGPPSQDGGDLPSPDAQVVRIFFTHSDT